jgi:hypothetical protein
MSDFGGVVHVAYLRAIVRRGLVLWLLCRLVVLSLGAFADALVLVLPPPGVTLLAGAVAGLADIDARAMRESVFHANLGTPAWMSALTGALLVLVIELVITVAVAVFG